MCGWQHSSLRMSSAEGTLRRSWIVPRLFTRPKTGSLRDFVRKGDHKEIMHLTYEFLPTRLSERRSKGLAMEFSAAKRTTCLNSVAEITLKQCHEPRICANAIHNGYRFSPRKDVTLRHVPRISWFLSGFSDVKTPTLSPAHLRLDHL